MLTEYGIDPNIKVDIKESDQLKNIDTIIEEAILHLKSKTSGKTITSTSDSTLIIHHGN
jgi:hypothetical protein